MLSTTSILKGSNTYNLFRSSNAQGPKTKDCFPSKCMTTNHSIDYPMALPVSSTFLSISYFSSPIRTLSESLEDFDSCISTHDLIEAYNLLSIRVRLLMKQKLPDGQNLPCMKAFHEDAGQIIQSISRDIRRLLPSPFDSPPQEYSYAGQSYFLDVSDDVDDVETMADNILVCQHALRLASDIFSFPTLYSAFTDTLLISLLYDMLSLTTPVYPPIPNIDKSSNTVLRVLQIQRLPLSILSSTEPTILQVLKRPLFDRWGCPVAKAHALKALHCIFKRHPIFVNSWIDLLPVVMEHLNVESLEVRLSAASALCGFASAKFNLENNTSYPHSKATEIARIYLDLQTVRTQHSYLPHEILLPETLQSALTNGEYWKSYGPSFMVVVVSSFLVLLDRSVWTSPQPLRLLVRNIAQIAGQKQSNIRHTHPEFWRILIWAFSRLPTHDDPNVLTSHKKSPANIRERAYQFLLQERRYRLSLDIIGTLLCPQDGERSHADVQKALDITLGLVTSDTQTSREDANRLLGRLVANICNPADVQLKRASVKAPFSCTLIDGSLLSRKANEIRVPRTAFDFLALQPLSEGEVLDHWADLTKVWTMAGQRCLDSDQNVSDLCDVWQALLLVRGDLMEESSHHFTASSAFANTVSEILAGFSIPFHTFDHQIRYILFTKKLWRVLRNVFTREWLSSPAEAALVLFLDKPFDLSNDEVKDAWLQFCAELIHVGIPSLLHILHARGENVSGKEAIRELWLAAAGIDAFVEKDTSVGDLLRFLAIPIGWNMSPSEFETWEKTLATAYDRCPEIHHSSRDLPSRFLEGLTIAKIDLLKKDPRMLHNLLSRWSPGSFSTAELKLFMLVDDYLYACHETMDSEDDTYGSTLRLLRAVGDVISNTDASDIVHLLSIMQKSLCCWITDEREVLDNSLHDEIVTLLYKRPLELLSRVEPSIAVLTDLAEFIHSVFLRVRGDGVFAFQAFWRMTYHVRRDIPKELYPDQIKACLQAWSDFFEDSFADDIPSDSGSQNLDTSSIPDSQLAESMSFGAQSYPEGYQTIFYPEINAASGSYGARTPAPRDHALPSTERTILTNMPIKEDDVFQSYGGRYEQSQLQPSDVENRVLRSIDDGNIASTSKRTGEFETPPAKRRRFEESHVNIQPRAGKERAQEPSRSYKSNSSMLLSSLSQPATRRPSPILRPSASQPSQSLRRSSAASWLESDHRGTTLSVDPPMSRARADATPSSEDDYDSWERGVSDDGLRAMRMDQNDDLDYIVPDSQDNPDSGIENEDSGTDDVGDVLSPSLGECLLRARQRSQTAPDNLHFNTLPHAQPLRRHQTSPGLPTGTPAVDALQAAYAVLTDTMGVSQVDVEDILQARRLATQIHQAIDEQICAKISSSRPRTPADDDEWC